MKGRYQIELNRPTIILRNWYNLSFEKWTQVFGSIELTAALIDRFTHNCEIFMFDGDSVRLREAKERGGKKQLETETM